MSIKKNVVTVFCLLVLPLISYAQPALIHSYHLPAVEAGESPPLRDIPQSSAPSVTKSAVMPLHRRKITDSTRYPKTLSVIDPLISLQRNTALNLALPLIGSFDGLSGSDDKAIFGEAYTPPDINGDVGENHYVQMVNTLYQVFDKNTGLPLTPPSKLSSLFKAAGKTGVCATHDEGDPIVVYDHLAKRWLLSEFNFAYTALGNDKPPYHECVAISKTDDPTGGYYVYDFVIPKNRFGDYPKFGVWSDGYYMTTEHYTALGYYLGEAVLVFDRAKMLIGQPAAANYHNLSTKYNLTVLLPSDLDGAPPPLGTPNYVIGFKNKPSLDVTNRIRIFEVTADFSANGVGKIIEKTGLTTAALNPFKCSNSSGYCINQPDTTKRLDALADRPMYRLQYRYFSNLCPLDNSATACGSLVFNHTVQGLNYGESAVRWYVLKHNLSTKNLTISQQGTFAPDASSRWLGSAALNKRGDLAIGYSVSSGLVYPSIHYAGRLVTDPKNTLSISGVLQQGSGSQTSSNRWGDYSMMAVDPVDDCTFWYTNEYYSSVAKGQKSLWQSRIGHFKLSDLCN